MKKKQLTRRMFVKKTSIGAAGVAMTSAGMSSIYSNVIQDVDKPAILGGIPVRPQGTDLGVAWH
ncbi:MAG: twin-arginine translocation signal domain-containing protein [Bacteroidales bacterium]|nr:twin-arginine translocation signal domain-containing protein [Bacteroidales bacterium]